MPSPVKKQRVNLHILSPIHVGTGQDLDPFSYVIREKELVFIDLIRWMETFSDKETLHGMMESDNFAYIRSYIAEHFDDEAAVLYRAAIDHPELVATYQRVIREKDAKNQVLISPIVRNDITMEAFLPGSSIKGAIRTAIANAFVEVAGVTSKHAVRNKRTREGDYNEKIFGRINQDPMKWLKIADVSLGQGATVITEAREYPLDPNKPLTPKGATEATQNLCQSGQPVVYPLGLSFAPFTLHKQRVDLQFVVDALYEFYAPKYAQEFAKFYNAPRANQIREAIAPMSRAFYSLKTNEAVVRVGHYSHAECVTLDNVRQPKTRMGKDKRPLPWGQTRTLANGLHPFGWAKLEFLDLKSDERPARKWPFNSEGTSILPQPRRQDAVQGTPAGERPISIKKRPVRRPSVLDEQPVVSALLSQVKVVRPNDKVAMQRIVDALSEMEDEAEQEKLARALKEKLEAANLWKKSPYRFDIEMFLE